MEASYCPTPENRHDVQEPVKPLSSSTNKQHSEQGLPPSAKRHRVSHESSSPEDGPDEWELRRWRQRGLSCEPRNVAARRRNELFNRKFAALHAEIPALHGYYRYRPINKVHVLDEAVKYIRHLKSQIEANMEDARKTEESKEAPLD